MRLCSFLLPSGEPAYGVLEDDVVSVAGERLRRDFPDLRSLLAGDGVDQLRVTHKGAESLPLRSVTLKPPITSPDKILCVGLNYMSHILETGREAPKHPSIFTRYPSSLVGHGEALAAPTVSPQFDYEGELAVVIGKAARNVAAESALSIVAGFTCFNDGSVRDYQRHTTQFWPGKNFGASGAVGPALTLVDEVGDYRACKLETAVNGVVVQRAPLSDLAFDVPTLIAYISTVIELLPGDIIATGTPGGVGLYRDPPLWLKPGDTVGVSISGVGRLENRVAAC